MEHNGHSISNQLKGLLVKECCVCGAPLFLSYVVDGYGNMACVSHRDEIIYCSSCQRMCGTDSISIGAGRRVCANCHDNLPDESSCKRIEAYVRKVLLDNGLSIPAFKLERVSAERFVSLGHPNASGLASKVGNKYVVYVLCELINTALAEVLAHEMTHIWQWENSVSVRTEINEGFCNLASFIVLKGIDTDMAKIKVRNLELNPDSIYGVGFRKVKEYYDRNGMDMTIKKMETRR